MSLQERDFFVEKQEMRNTRLTCTRCRRTNDYQLRWMRRTKKDRIPNGADERDRAIFAKLRDYLLRLDDMVTCCDLPHALRSALPPVARLLA